MSKQLCFLPIYKNNRPSCIVNLSDILEVQKRSQSAHDDSVKQQCTLRSKIITNVNSNKILDLNDSLDFKLWFTTIQEIMKGVDESGSPVMRQAVLVAVGKSIKG